MRRGRCLWLVAGVVIAMVATATAGPAAAQGPHGFADAGEHFAAEDIEALGAEGVFDGTGCGTQGEQALFCPEEALQRWVMAVWLVRILDGAEPAAVDSTRFSDVDASVWWAAHVERFAQLGVTLGYPDGTYRPERSVSRAQMAAFLTRAFDLPEAPDAGFTDTADNTHSDAINRLAAAGVTKGCGAGTTYCPDRDTRRGEMAAFINRARASVAEAEAQAEAEATTTTTPAGTGGNTGLPETPTASTIKPTDTSSYPSLPQTTTPTTIQPTPTTIQPTPTTIQPTPTTIQPTDPGGFPDLQLTNIVSETTVNLKNLVDGSRPAVIWVFSHY